MNTATTGYYSLVQYCPDRSRLEAANIGVVLLCPALGFLEARFSSANDRVRRFFGEEAGDLQQLNAMKQMLERRLAVDRNELLEPGAFENFRRLLSNELQISASRALRIENPQAELAQLYEELVGNRVRQEPSPLPPAFEKLSEKFDTDAFSKLVRRNVRIHIPLMGKELTVPFAYQNGRLNLIETHQFGQQREADVLQDACRTAVQGNLIYKHPDPEYGECQLIVVGSFRHTLRENREKVAGILRDHHVLFYEEEQTDELARQILQTAHE